MRKVRPVEDRFWEKVDKTGDCWLWTASDNGKGYGRFWTGSALALAHRYAYELLVGPIPAGLHIDHLCRNRACVNPDHLEPVTNRENLVRGDTQIARQVAQTSCINGHPLTGENLRIRSDGRRRCLACQREHERNRPPRSKVRKEQTPLGVPPTGEAS